MYMTIRMVDREGLSHVVIPVVKWVKHLPRKLEPQVVGLLFLEGKQT